VYDVFFATIGLMLLSPVLTLIALLVKLGDGGPVFYRQRRIGQYGVPFLIIKFRTMVPNADKLGLSITSNGDQRITRVGRLLRKTKLDELPQLWNVLRGEMSLVGPRPEVPRYVEFYTPDQRAILNYKPGITDLASLRFREEESLLHAGEGAEQFYIEQCVPRKLELNQEYARQANLRTDTWIILQTLCPYWVGVMGIYAFILSASFAAAYALVSNFDASAWGPFARQLPLVVGLQLICLLARRQYKGLLCYFGLSELGQTSIGLAQAALMLTGFWLVGGKSFAGPNVILTDLCTSLLFLAGFRVLMRLWRERTESDLPQTMASPVRVGIIGAGSVGARLASCLLCQRKLGRIPVAFFDDDFAKWRKQIHQIPVVGMPECLAQGWSEKLDEVIIALPETSAARLQKIYECLAGTRLKVYTLEWLWPVRTDQKASDEF
jgi:lipopolysaccharide/colanic/teichoic acid biosynthesis glycosyltransferase